MGHSIEWYKRDDPVDRQMFPRKNSGMNLVDVQSTRLQAPPDHETAPSITSPVKAGHHDADCLPAPVGYVNIHFDPRKEYCRCESGGSSPDGTMQALVGG